MYHAAVQVGQQNREGGSRYNCQPCEYLELLLSRVEPRIVPLEDEVLGETADNSMTSLRPAGFRDLPSIVWHSSACSSPIRLVARPAVAVALDEDLFPVLSFRSLFKKPIAVVCGVASCRSKVPGNGIAK